MQVVEHLNEMKARMDMVRDRSVAVGTFDGMHIGHQEVVAAAVRQKENGLQPAVFTFSDSPHGKAQICLKEEKLWHMEQAGVETVYCLPFAAVRSMSGETFVKEVLQKGCGAKVICCGQDFHFGSGAAGDVAALQQLGTALDFDVTVVPDATLDGEKVSSTAIRQALVDGGIRLANEMLGRPYGFTLEVIHGNHIGTGLGMPTINQALPTELVLPKFGVYASYVKVDGQYQFGVTNIGVKPTVGSDRVLSETWMPDFEGDLYGRRLRVYLLDFIRPEQKFSSLAEMKGEINKNAVTARQIAKESSWFFFQQSTLQS